MGRRSPAERAPYGARRAIAALTWGLLLLASYACDGVYAVKGRALTAARAREGPVTLEGGVTDTSLAGLAGVQVQVFHPQDDAGRLLPVAGTVSEDEGRYHRTFVGPPRATDRYILEFRKTGFRTRRVALGERVRDPAVRVGPCTEGERWTGCWVVDVVMVPDGS